MDGLRLTVDLTANFILERQELAVVAVIDVNTAPGIDDGFDIFTGHERRAVAIFNDWDADGGYPDETASSAPRSWVNQA